MKIPLKRYAAKRNFKQTGEPSSGRTRRAGKELLFVVQKHKARRLHYDFRLEMNGVLKSWAVPKGLSTVRGERRLAVHVEDHPFEYRDFEGTIAPGNYGAGTVMVWDAGTYSVESGEPSKEYEQGRLHLRLNGQKLRGEWVLVRTGETDNWFIIKSRESAPAVSEKDDDKSVLSGRTMAQIAVESSPQGESGGAAGAKPRPCAAAEEELKNLPEREPRFLEPMKPEAVRELPQGADWLYEAKLDGFRAVIVKDDGKCSLISRNKKTLSDRFPSIIRQARALPCRAVIDGEIVMLDERGVPSFQALQGFSPGNDASNLIFFAFDLLNFEGRSLLDLPLQERRRLLAGLLEDSRIQFSADLQADPEVLVSSLRDLGIEGVVAKRKDSRYQPGRRTEAWQKLKLNVEQEFVIGGFTKGKPFDALIVGYYEGKDLLFAGKVRGGLTPRLRSYLGRLLEPLIVEDCPFANLPEEKSGRWGEGLGKTEMRNCVWVRPEISAEIAFTEWTRSNHLRNAAFKGIREDIDPHEVRKEPIAEIR